MHIVDSHSAKQLNNVEIPAKSTNNSKTKNATSNDATGNMLCLMCVTVG